MSHCQQGWMERTVRAVLDDCDEEADNLCNLTDSIDNDLGDSEIGLEARMDLIAQGQEFGNKLIACSRKANRAIKLLKKLRSRASYKKSGDLAAANADLGTTIA